MTETLPVTRENIKRLSRLASHYKPFLLDPSIITFESRLKVPVYVELDGEKKRRSSMLASHRSIPADLISCHLGHGQPYDMIVSLNRDHNERAMSQKLWRVWGKDGVTTIQHHDESVPIRSFELKNVATIHEQTMEEDADLLRDLHRACFHLEDYDEYGFREHRA